MPQRYNLHIKRFVGGSDFDRDYVGYVLAKNAKQPVVVLIDSTGETIVQTSAEPQACLQAMPSAAD